MLSKSASSRKALQRMLQVDKARARRMLANRSGHNEADNEEVESAMTHSALLRLANFISTRKDRQPAPRRPAASRPDHNRLIRSLPYATSSVPVPWLAQGSSNRGASTELTLTEELEAFASYVSAHNLMMDATMQLSPAETDCRSNFLSELREAILAKYPHATVNTFGSFDAGLSIFLSDLDLYIDREKNKKRRPSQDASDPISSDEDGTQSTRSSDLEDDAKPIGWSVDTKRAAAADGPTSISQQNNQRPPENIKSAASYAANRKVTPSTSSISSPLNISREDLDIFVTTHTSRLPPASSSSSSSSSIAAASTTSPSPRDIELSDCSLLSPLHDSDGEASVTEVDQTRIVHEALNTTAQVNLHIHYEREDEAGEADDRQLEASADGELLESAETTRLASRGRKRTLEMDLTVSVLEQGKQRDHQVTDESSLAANDVVSDLEETAWQGRRSRDFSMELDEQDEGRRRPRRAELGDLFRFMKSLGWVRRIEYWKNARVPIINVTHLSSVEADISYGLSKRDTVMLVRRMSANGGRAFFVLSAFLKTYLYQLQLDRPVNGGLGSFKLYALLSLHLERYAQTVAKQAAQGNDGALDGHDNLGLMLLSFLQYYGNPLNLNNGTILNIQGETVSLRQTTLIDPIRKAFDVAYTVLTERCRRLERPQKATKKKVDKSPSFLAALLDSLQLAIERKEAISACTRYPVRTDEDRDSAAVAVMKRLQMQARLAGTDLDKLLSVAKTQLPHVYTLLWSHYQDGEMNAAERSSDPRSLPPNRGFSKKVGVVAVQEARPVKFTARGVIGQSIAEMSSRDSSGPPAKRRAESSKMDMAMLDEKIRRMKDTIDALNMKIQRQQKQPQERR